LISRADCRIEVHTCRRVILHLWGNTSAQAQKHVRRMNWAVVSRRLPMPLPEQIPCIRLRVAACDCDLLVLNVPFPSAGERPNELQLPIDATAQARLGHQAFASCRRTISCKHSRNTLSSPSFRRPSNMTSSVLMVFRPACFAKASRSVAVVTMCAQTSSVREPMNCGVALTPSLMVSSSTSAPMWYQRVALRRW